MTALSSLPHSHSLTHQVLPRVEAKLLGTKTYQQALTALDTETPPARSVLEAHLRAISRTSIRLMLAELQAGEPPASPPSSQLEPTPPTLTIAPPARSSSGAKPTSTSTPERSPAPSPLQFRKCRRPQPPMSGKPLAKRWGAPSSKHA
ncbi:MAG: hypothetical protein HC910_09385 [Spirulinaceae cyanobacterium SM2_1_0]|nr:hypothetical protein [Spirulinaceae cyanobacterium SM2_1_0]